jgi:hypothetical protein
MTKQNPHLSKSAHNRIAQRWAKDIAALCVRMTCIESIHAGRIPQSKTGDYSDVKVVTPSGEIPWAEVSRMSDDEMRQFMQQVTDRLYTVLAQIDDVDFMERLHSLGQKLTAQWGEPQYLPKWCARREEDWET